MISSISPVLQKTLYIQYLLSSIYKLFEYKRYKGYCIENPLSDKTLAQPPVKNRVYVMAIFPIAFCIVHIRTSKCAYLFSMSQILFNRSPSIRTIQYKKRVFFCYLFTFFVVFHFYFYLFCIFSPPLSDKSHIGHLLHMHLRHEPFDLYSFSHSKKGTVKTKSLIQKYQGLLYYA